MSESVKEITDKSFDDEVTNSDGIVVVDYYAQWCRPCKMLSILMEDLSREYSGSVKIVKGDVDENSVSVSKFRIQGVPAILVFKNGSLRKQSVGLRSKTEIKKDIEEVMNA